jgi:hypothetical protein
MIQQKESLSLVFSFINGIELYVERNCLMPGVNILSEMKVRKTTIK